ncbi:hypothetical protein E5161_14885 [Cohnella pontilimi]|uniref:Uncharacterized protein n=1 Tax=Cohnella pontilimi TaxID=2564100 RepID=A0A4U0F8D3_9BACL|nr:hypothetical protein [Cohnella pontilimi]TJY40996.1 hypothetical protein E5161_14885 [Cohnella pontilimi]
MEQYELATLSVIEGIENRTIAFEKAKLTVVSDYGTRLWYIDVDGIDDEPLLERFAESDEIGVRLEAVSIGGKRFGGRGFFHPNPRRRSAAIRGDGELEGYQPQTKRGE